MAEQIVGSVETDVAQKRRTRSPSYPGISLREAIEKAKLVYQADGRAASPISAVFTHFGYRPKSGSGYVAIGAMQKFNLIEVQGAGDNRLIKLTGLALKIILCPPDHERERMEAIQEAAQSPDLHASLLKEFDGNLPSAQNLKYRLLMEHGFTESGAADFIRQIEDTFAFANLGDRGNLSPAVVKDEREVPIMAPIAMRSNNDCPADIIQQPVNEDVFRLPEGMATIKWPNHLSAESCEDFEDWLKLVVRKVKRSFQKKDGVEKIARSEE